MVLIDFLGLVVSSATAEHRILGSISRSDQVLSRIWDFYEFLSRRGVYVVFSYSSLSSCYTTCYSKKFTLNLIRVTF